MGTTADKLARLNETKALLKTRLTEKGLDVASENNFYNLANKVGEIQSGTIEVLTYNINSSDYIDTKSYYDEDMSNEFYEGAWTLTPPFVFKSNIYSSIQDLLSVVPKTAINFSIQSPLYQEMFLVRPNSLSNSLKFTFISKNIPLHATTFYMFVDFGQEII